MMSAVTNTLPDQGPLADKGPLLGERLALGKGLGVRFWGVRGSHPVCGPRFAHFGGNTPCVEVSVGGQRFVLDAGAGLIELGQELCRDVGCPGNSSGDFPGNFPGDIHLMLSHLHHDHISGLPFFKPALRPDCRIHTWCGNLGGDSAGPALGVMYQPPLFPVTLDQLPATFEHHGFHAGETLEIAGCQIRTCLLQHPAGATGYRFDHNGHAVCYISDIEHGADGPCPELKKFVAGADLVIYDSMFLEEEYCRCIGWGHSTWREGVRLCREGGAKAMAMFHLHPDRDDDAHRLIEAELARELPGSFVAREGLTLNFR